MVAQYECKRKEEKSIIVSGDGHITEKQKNAVELKNMFCTASLIGLDICSLYLLFIYLFHCLIACLFFFHVFIQSFLN